MCGTNRPAMTMPLLMAAGAQGNQQALNAMPQYMKLIRERRQLLRANGVPTANYQPAGSGGGRSLLGS